jgi:dynein heavy chain
MSDLFPGKKRPPIDYGPLLASLKLATERRRLQPIPLFLKKNIELYEMICVRHGLMVVGPTGGGKSNNIKVLQLALTRLNREGTEGIRYDTMHVHHLNPKSITMGQLYGQFDPNTHEWQDGILATMIRGCIRDTRPDGQGVLFDGPVDAIWIANMNTVLDDNKKLCLTSGEIMALSEPMTMMFEPEDLAVASPATVSRCGMIYMEPHSLGYECLIVSWMEYLPACFTTAMHVTLKHLFDSYIPTVINVLRRNLVEPMPTSNNTLLRNIMKLMDCYFDEFREKEGVDPKTPSQIADLGGCIEPLFIFCMIWTCCCTVDMNGRLAFDSYIRAEMASCGSEHTVPPEGLVYDYKYDLEEKRWVGWMDTISPYKYDSKMEYAELIIPTLDSVRYCYLFHTLLVNGKHVLMVGPTGTGKTVNIQSQVGTSR